MSRILNQRESDVTRYVPRQPITSIIHRPSSQSEWVYIATITDLASCIACSQPRCIKYEEHELLPSDEQLSSFPIDLTNTVCATGAIQWQNGNPHPTINPSACIKCGVCAARCPVGAISIDPESAKVHFDPESIVEATSNKQNEMLAELRTAFHAGYLHDPCPANIEAVYQKIESIHTDARFPNLIVRNLLLARNQKALIRRRGDVYLRIDSIAELDESIAVFEIEFHKDSLESPRAILDDIAVLNSRYGVSKEQIRPFIVSYEFPNLRTEYWRVIKDIKNVLNISIESLSLGVLLMFVWLQVGSIQSQSFYADIDHPSISEAVEREVDGSLETNRFSRAILMPSK